jgi:hypothetical protein
VFVFCAMHKTKKDSCFVFVRFGSVDFVFLNVFTFPVWTRQLCQLNFFNTYFVKYRAFRKFVVTRDALVWRFYKRTLHL